MVSLHPQYIRSNGRDEFVVLPREEFAALCELLEDLEDLRLIEEARIENAGKPGMSIDELRRELDLEPIDPS